MLRVAWLIIVYRAEASAAYAARCGHGFESGPVLAPQGAVLMSGVCHWFYITRKAGSMSLSASPGDCCVFFLFLRKEDHKIIP